MYNYPIHNMTTSFEGTTMSRDKYMERYARLALQSDQLRQRISITPPNERVSPPDSDVESPDASPTRQTPNTISYSLPITNDVWPHPQSVPSAYKLSGLENDDESNLYEINHQIKALLTELLNCDSVKHDKSYRAWVQARLMEAEHELKTQRRRRSSVTLKTIGKIGRGLGSSPVRSCRASF